MLSLSLSLSLLSIISLSSLTLLFFLSCTSFPSPDLTSQKWGQRWEWRGDIDLPSSPLPPHLLTRALHVGPPLVRNRHSSEGSAMPQDKMAARASKKKKRKKEKHPVSTGFSFPACPWWSLAFPSQQRHFGSFVSVWTLARRGVSFGVHYIAFLVDSL